MGLKIMKYRTDLIGGSRGLARQFFWRVAFSRRRHGDVILSSLSTLSNCEIKFKELAYF